MLKAKLIPAMPKRSPWGVKKGQTNWAPVIFWLALKKKDGRITSLGFLHCYLAFLEVLKSFPTKQHTTVRKKKQQGGQVAL